VSPLPAPGQARPVYVRWNPLASRWEWRHPTTEIWVGLLGAPAQGASCEQLILGYVMGRVLGNRENVRTHLFEATALMEHGLYRDPALVKEILN
jgi:hypothetical protein